MAPASASNVGATSVTWVKTRMGGSEPICPGRCTKAGTEMPPSPVHCLVCANGVALTSAQRMPQTTMGWAFASPLSVPRVSKMPAPLPRCHLPEMYV